VIAMMGALLAMSTPASALQCVPFAREVSGISLRGDAWTWWRAASGLYDRGQTPKPGAVVVFKRHGHMSHGHVAVVARVLNSRHILVDHANWAPHRAAGRGQVTTMVAVIDVSRRNDWSEVRVWSVDTGEFGTSVYPTYGFIYPAAARSTARLGAASNAAIQQAKAEYSELPSQFSRAIDGPATGRTNDGLALDFNMMSEELPADIEASAAPRIDDLASPMPAPASIAVARLDPPAPPVIAVNPVVAPPPPAPSVSVPAVTASPVVSPAPIAPAPIVIAAAAPSYSAVASATPGVWEGDAAAAKTAGSGHY
jgi:surface antigen